MKVYTSLIALYFLFLPLTGYAKSYDAQFQICKLGSSCSECIETISLRFDVDEKNSQVSVVRETPEDKNFRAPLKNCEILTSIDWSCNDLRGRVAAVGGHLTYSSSAKYFEKVNKAFDICLKQ